MIHSIKL